VKIPSGRYAAEDALIASGIPRRQVVANDKCIVETDGVQDAIDNRMKSMRTPTMIQTPLTPEEIAKNTW